MFLASLTEPQKEAFLSLASKFIASDGKLQIDELNMLTLMKHEMELSAVNQPIDEPMETLYAYFDTHKTKVIALLELVGLGHADNEYDTTESEFIRAMAHSLGFTDEDVLVYENWVQRQLALTREALTMMEED